MNILGNIIWFVFGGFMVSLGWYMSGVLWCITIIGIPVGLQCFKFGNLALWPFGRDVYWSDSPTSLLLNIIWLIISGIPLAIAHAITGGFFCITIIGIPFGLQHFKLAKLALMPFGATIR